MPESDTVLIGRAVAGDNNALSLLLERYGPVARRAITGQIPEDLRSALSEDDLMQETYADAFLAIGGFVPKGDGSFPAWLRTLAKRNLLDAIDELRAIKRGRGWQRVEPVSPDDSYLDLFEKLGATTTTPSRELARKEAKDAITRAVQQLPAVYRCVVEMYELKGQRVEEVAAVVGRSIGAVFMVRSRALKMLQEILEKGSTVL